MSGHAQKHTRLPGSANMSNLNGRKRRQFRPTHLYDGVQLCGGGEEIPTVKVSLSLNHHTLDLIRFGQLTIGLHLVFATGVGLQLENTQTTGSHEHGRVVLLHRR